jgi:tetratricopeptide (TPR) repeat protein
MNGPRAEGPGAAAVGTNHGVVSTGPDAQIDNRTIVLPPGAIPPAATVAAPRLTGNLPRPASAAFVGRAGILAQLDAALAADGSGRVGHVVAGLGGVGKTELALQYVASRQDRYGVVWWVNADSVDSVTHGFAKLARTLNPMASAAWDTSEAAEWGLSWLTAHTDWLLVVDNVVEPEQIAAVVATAQTGGRVLVTSRRDGPWQRLGLTTRLLPTLEREDSLALLNGLLGAGADRDQVLGLAADLGDLPLALEQAGAYLRQRPQVGVAEYRRRLAVEPARTFKAVAQGTSEERAVAATWQITMKTVTAGNPLAGRVLGVAAYLAPQQIPSTLLQGLAGADVDPQEVEDAVALLGSYSMISLDADGGFAVHRLVQAITRADHDDDMFYRDAVTLLRGAMPFEPWSNVAGWPVWGALLPHLEAVFDRVPDQAGDDTLTPLAHLLDQAATYREGQGQLAEAITRFERAVKLRERVLGTEDPDTLTSRNNLAYALLNAGRLAEAIGLFEQTLADRERVLGTDDADTLTSRHNLAYAYEIVGRLDEAILLYEQNLPDTERVQGADHPDSFTARNNLAGAYHAVGRVAEAITLHKQVRDDRERVLGPDHPETLASWNNLAFAYASAGQLTGALNLFQQNLDDYERVMGANHPSALQARNNLASAYGASGRHEDAIRLHQETLAGRAQMLGPEHPDTIYSRHNLAAQYHETDRLSEAIPLYEQTLELARRVLGDDHPLTSNATANLEMARAQSGQGSGRRRRR